MQQTKFLSVSMLILGLCCFSAQYKSTAHKHAPQVCLMSPYIITSHDSINTQEILAGLQTQEVWELEEALKSLKKTLEKHKYLLRTYYDDSFLRPLSAKLKELSRHNHEDVRRFTFEALAQMADIENKDIAKEILSSMNTLLVYAGKTFLISDYQGALKVVTTFLKSHNELIKHMYVLDIRRKLYEHDWRHICQIEYLKFCGVTASMHKSYATKDLFKEALNALEKDYAPEMQSKIHIAAAEMILAFLTADQDFASDKELWYRVQKQYERRDGQVKILLGKILDKFEEIKYQWLKPVLDAEPDLAEKSERLNHVLVKIRQNSNYGGQHTYAYNEDIMKHDLTELRDLLLSNKALRLLPAGRIIDVIGPLFNVSSNANLYLEAIQILGLTAESYDWNSVLEACRILTTKLLNRQSSWEYNLDYAEALRAWKKILEQDIWYNSKRSITTRLPLYFDVPSNEKIKFSDDVQMLALQILTLAAEKDPRLSQNSDYFDMVLDSFFKYENFLTRLEAALLLKQFISQNDKYVFEPDYRQRLAYLLKDETMPEVIVALTEIFKLKIFQYEPLRKVFEVELKAQIPPQKIDMIQAMMSQV